MKFRILPSVTNEMRAAGVEALRAAISDKLEEAELVEEIFLAMYGQGVYLEQETIH